MNAFQRQMRATALHDVKTVVMFCRKIFGVVFSCSATREKPLADGPRHFLRKTHDRFCIELLCAGPRCSRELGFVIVEFV